LVYDDFIWERIPKDNLLQAWVHIHPWIKKATDKVPTHLTPDFILKRAMNEESSIWIAYLKSDPLPLLGAASTAIHERGKSKILTIEALGGREISKWAHKTLHEFEKMVLQYGLDEIEIEGRPGWSRYLRNQGYSVRRIVVGKDLRNGR